MILMERSTAVRLCIMLADERQWVIESVNRTCDLTGIEQAKHTTVSHNQWNIGIHHYCLRLKSKEDVDEFHRLWLEKLTPLGGSVVQGPKEGTWAPGYYSSLFEDPDHVRIEVNFVPGKGLLGTGEKKLFAKF